MAFALNFIADLCNPDAFIFLLNFGDRDGETADGVLLDQKALVINVDWLAVANPDKRSTSGVYFAGENALKSWVIRLLKRRNWSKKNFFD